MEKAVELSHRAQASLLGTIKVCCGWGSGVDPAGLHRPHPSRLITERRLVPLVDSDQSWPHADSQCQRTEPGKGT